MVQTECTFIIIKHNICVLKVPLSLPSSGHVTSAAPDINLMTQGQLMERNRAHQRRRGILDESVCLLSWATGALCHHHKHWDVSVRADKAAALISARRHKERLCLGVSATEDKSCGKQMLSTVRAEQTEGFIRSRTCWAVPPPSSEASPSFVEMFIIDRGGW